MYTQYHRYSVGIKNVDQKKCIFCCRLSLLYSFFLILILNFVFCACVCVCVCVCMIPYISLYLRCMVWYEISYMVLRIIIRTGSTTVAGETWPNSPPCVHAWYWYYSAFFIFFSSSGSSTMHSYFENLWKRSSFASCGDPRLLYFVHC